MYKMWVLDTSILLGCADAIDWVICDAQGKFVEETCEAGNVFQTYYIVLCILTPDIGIYYVMLNTLEMSTHKEMAVMGQVNIKL